MYGLGFGKQVLAGTVGTEPHPGAFEVKQEFD